MLTSLSSEKIAPHLDLKLRNKVLPHRCLGSNLESLPSCHAPLFPKNSLHDVK